MHMTNNGDMIVAIGSGTGSPASQKGTVLIRREGEMLGQSIRPANLSGAKWTCEGESNPRKRISVIYMDINRI
jgi:hypothetical protein